MVFLIKSSFSADWLPERVRPSCKALSQLSLVMTKCCLNNLLDTADGDNIMIQRPIIFYSGINAKNSSHVRFRLDDTAFHCDKFPVNDQGGVVVPPPRQKTSWKIITSSQRRRSFWRADNHSIFSNCSRKADMLTSLSIQKSQWKMIQQIMTLLFGVWLHKLQTA